MQLKHFDYQKHKSRNSNHHWILWNKNLNILHLIIITFCYTICFDLVGVVKTMFVTWLYLFSVCFLGFALIMVDRGWTEWSSEGGELWQGVYKGTHEADPDRQPGHHEHTWRRFQKLYIRQSLFWLFVGQLLSFVAVCNGFFLVASFLLFGFGFLYLFICSGTSYTILPPNNKPLKSLIQIGNGLCR